MKGNMRNKRNIIKILVIIAITITFIADMSFAEAKRKTLFHKHQQEKREERAKTAGQEMVKVETRRTEAPKIVEVDDFGFSFPADAGMLKESYPANDPDAPLIVFIQDAHCNYEAQLNTVRILEALSDQKGMELILREGGVGDISLKFLREHTPESRLEVSEKYMTQGLFSACEYFEVTTDYPLILWGIEKGELYDKNMEAFLGVEPKQREVLEYLDKVKDVVHQAKARFYTDKALDVERKRRNYDNEKLSLANYLEYLKEQSPVIFNKPAYQEVVAFKEASSLEDKIIFRLVSREASEVVTRLGEQFDSAQGKELLARTEAFKKGKAAQNTYYSYLKKLAGEMINEASYPNLTNYLEYLRIYSGIDTEALFTQIKELSEEVIRNSLKDKTALKVAEISYDLEILKSMVNLKASPHEFDYFKKDKARFNVNKWINELAGLGAQGTGALLPINANLNAILPSAISFYEIAAERDLAFIKETNKKMRETKAPIASMIVGGFHTRPMVQKLRDSGYSVCVIAPKIEQATDTELYYNALKYEYKPFEDE